MKERTHVTPTKGELEILQVLWKLGPSTVRQVHEKIGRSMAYTTALKLLQIMTEKGLVERKEDGRAHIYKPVITEHRGTRSFLHDLVNRVFGGSSSKLVMQALDAGGTTKEEIQEIRDLLDRLEKKSK